MASAETSAVARAVHDALAPHVDRGAIPGMAALVTVGDVLHVEVLGTAALGDTAPLERDAIFRIASLSKPVAAAAAMALVADGLLDLDASVDDLLPELAQPRVLRTLGSDLDDTVPAVRPITVEDLLTLRMGFGIVMAPPGTYPIQDAEAAAELRSFGPPWPPTPHGPDEWMRRLGTLPLIDQPGASWLYNTSSQVLGVLLARAAGVPLDQLLHERIFDPLGMRDSGFFVAPSKMDRFVTAYHPDPETGVPHVSDVPSTSYWARPPTFPDASGWLVSTLDDYWAFVQMISHGGLHRDRRILSEAAVARMTTDHLTAAQRADACGFLGDGGGWGYGMRAPAAGVKARFIPGGFGWDGGSGVTWRTDAPAGVTGILFTQCEMVSPEPPAVFTDFWRAVYGVLA